MSHINTVALSGRATRDPEYVEMPSGNNLAKFGLAVERSWVSKETQERVVKTSFFDINVWGPFSDVIFAKVRKGDALTISGSIEQETWVDRETSQNRSKHVVNANQVDGDALYRKADGSDTPERDVAQPEQHGQQQQQQQLPTAAERGAAGLDPATPPPTGVGSSEEPKDDIPF